MDVRPFDALLFVSFGGPERPEEVVPFLERVTAGRGIPRERLEEVGEHYFLFGGRSPINDLNRDMIAALQREFAEHGIDLPIYWGNRNSDPLLRDTMKAMVDDGIRRAAYLVTSAYSSYSGCRQYRENLAEAVDGLDLELTRTRLYFNHPGFIEPMVRSVRDVLHEAPDGSRVVYVTHSIPDSMNAASGGPGVGAYRRQHQEVADLVSSGAGVDRHDLVYCSRSGSPRIPWLEPDINDHIESLAGEGVPGVIVVPIGFVSDHMEVVYDLDTEAKQTAEGLGLWFRRVPTPGADPAFISMLRDVVVEEAAAQRGEVVERATVGTWPPNPQMCGIDCCANARGDVPAVR